MKLALLSDIHSNIQAFDACVADARTRGATQFAFVGDYVGSGANPGEVVDKMAAAYMLQGALDAMQERRA